MTPECFLVPTDFSPDADEAFCTAITLGQPLRAHIVLLHVRDQSELDLLAYTGGAEAGVRAMLRDRLKPAEAAGLSGEVVLVHGKPWQEIMDIARKHHATLIIMGTHGRSGLRQLLLGSVTEKVVRHASCPVLVTRCAEAISQPQGSPA
ncbi:MAG: universal stress protein [Gammaproteobacteria bacterium]|nr:universal stress protein [Gammaproteobacteria bacterium]